MKYQQTTPHRRIRFRRRRLTNVRALMERLPMENIIYFGDTARVPYGTKSRATIETFAMQIVDFLLETMSKHWLSRATLSPPLPDRKSAKKRQYARIGRHLRRCRSRFANYQK